MAEGSEVAVVEATVQSSAVVLWGTDNPAGMVRRMTDVADALRDAIRKRGMTNQISGREYVRVEGWSMAGAMIGIFPKPASVAPMLDADGRIYGYRAEIELVARAGYVVGGAVAYCTRDEKMWGDREDNQLASMAQTRATAKAYRQTLGFIMPMAGYQATPAEEMSDFIDTPGDGERRRPAPARERRPAQERVGPTRDDREELEKRNGTVEPARVDTVGSLVQWGRFHYGLDGPHVAAALGVENVGDIAAKVGTGPSAWDDARAAIIAVVAGESNAERDEG